MTVWGHDPQARPLADQLDVFERRELANCFITQRGNRLGGRRGVEADLLLGRTD
jgi:hypothetical protein